MPPKIRQFLALLLCCQPVFWMSNVALAQTLQQTPGTLANSPYNPVGGQPTTPGMQQGFTPEAGSPERTNSTVSSASLLPAVDQPVDPETYICGPGDVLDLSFWGLQNFRHRVTIDLEGRGFIPRIGYVSLGGQTLSQVRASLRESVGRYYPRLGFDLALADPRTFLVQAVGDVGRPGTYPARAVERAASLLLRAGGLGPRASKRRIEVRRKGGAVLKVDLELFHLEGDVGFNPLLLDGDIIQVPFEELTAKVDGAVNRPGRYELTGSRDLSELVSLAGGLSPSATRLMPVTVVRRNASDSQDLQLVPFVEGTSVPSLALQQDDIVRVPSFDELQRSVMVIGAVAGAVAGTAAGRAAGTAASAATPDEGTATKRLPFVDGDSVRTLLERVGGVGPLADLSGSYLLRGGDSVPVDLYALVMLKDLKADKAVQLGDTLVVPFKRRNILVEGAVFAPGPYPFNPKFGVEQYLALAGGRNRYALELDEVRLVTSNGETKMYRKDLQVEPGSALVVPERNFSRAELVGIGLAVSSVLFAIATLYITAKK
jgi:protein involved in polysaccharide export with SLBB domain